MAKYIDIGIDIGKGQSFKLSNYYRMCKAILSALKEHETLLEKHFSLLDEHCYQDKSLHLLVFDLMNCSRTYHFYQPKSVSARRRSPWKVYAAKKTEKANAQEIVDTQKEEKRQAKVAAIEKELDELESVSDGCEDISLIGVQVTSAQYGIGTVVAQDVNKIEVQFPDLKKKFVLSRKFPSRPRFEDDETIVEAFSEYGERMDRILSLRRELERLGV